MVACQELTFQLLQSLGAVVYQLSWPLGPGVKGVSYMLIVNAIALSKAARECLVCVRVLSLGWEWEKAATTGTNQP